MKLNIKELLLNKDFSKLSLKEKEFTLSKITKTEYEDIRFTITNSKKSFQNNYKDLEINKATKQNLSIAFKQKHQEQKTESIFINYWYTYKNALKPVMAIGVVIIGVLLFINRSKINDEPLANDIKNVTSFLNENNMHLEINAKHSSELIDSNRFSKDSILKMNEYLYMSTEGLYVN